MDVIDLKYIKFLEEFRSGDPSLFTIDSQVEYREKRKSCSVLGEKEPQTRLRSTRRFFFSPVHRLAITARTWKGNKTTDSTKPVECFISFY